MTVRELEAYSKDPNNTNVMDKLAKKTHTHKNMISDFITTKGFSVLEFAPLNVLVGLLRLAENHSESIPC